jgi:CheY-like chemotaxis protein/RNA polymerase subunit RPABC4/transcription elongation factor Spt4
MVIAQRLVRRICSECREQYEPGEKVRNRVGMFNDQSPVYRGRGCPACGGTGFAGRIGIYEIYRPTNAIRKLINDRASEADMRMAARQAGMVPLREDALAKIRAGITSPDEVLRVVQVDENEVPCPGCKALIEADFATCPYCRINLKTNCRSCGQALRLDWGLCPYCNTPTVAESKPDAPQPVRVEVAVSMPAAAVAAQPAGEAVVAPPAAPEPPVVTPEPPVVTPEPPVITPEPPVITPEPPVVSPAAEPLAPAGPAAAPTVNSRPLRVLVVDDDPDIRMIVAATLRKMPVPMDIVQAADGLEALEKAREATPDLVVLDVMMPRMDGFETCRGLREKVQTAFVPILMLTASADQDSRTKGYLIGTDDYMAKPFLPVDLKLRIARLLRRTYGI